MQFMLLENEQPPEDTLVLVWMGSVYGYGLRRLRKGEWYDDSEYLDDSGVKILQWAKLPKPR